MENGRGNNTQVIAVLSNPDRCDRLNTSEQCPGLPSFAARWSAGALSDKRAA